MKIDTRFEPCDHVWIIQGSAIHKATIEAISLDITFERISAKYKLSIKGRKSLVTKDEDEIWSALDQLVDDVSTQA